MDLKKIRNAHLYLGCFFAPLIILFTLTGIIQTFDWHESKYGKFDANTGNSEIIYQPPAVIKIATTMHMNHEYKGFWFRTNDVYRYFVLAMSLGLLVTMILGVLMALKFASPKFVWLLLLSGVAVPILLILIKG